MAFQSVPCICPTTVQRQYSAQKVPTVHTGSCQQHLKSCGLGTGMTVAVCQELVPKQHQNNNLVEETQSQKIAPWSRKVYARYGGRFQGNRAHLTACQCARTHGLDIHSNTTTNFAEGTAPLHTSILGKTNMILPFTCPHGGCHTLKQPAPAVPVALVHQNLPPLVGERLFWFHGVPV